MTTKEQHNDIIRICFSENSTRCRRDILNRRLLIQQLAVLNIGVL